MNRTSAIALLEVGLTDPDVAYTWRGLREGEQEWLIRYIGRSITPFGRHGRAKEVIHELRYGVMNTRAYFGPMTFQANTGPYFR